MGSLKQIYEWLKSWGSKTWLQWLLAAIIFFFVSWFYMGSAINQCSSVSPAFNSDTSGGTVWFQWASGNKLSWGKTNLSNYPLGENLNRPQFITSETFDLPYRILARLSTPICGLNLMILLAYMSAALAMFGLVKWLFKRTALAYFAGFAAAYVPFHQIKSESHVVYMFGAPFILLVWAFLWFIEKPSYAKSLLLAALTALGFYFDGYFILLTAVLISSLWVLLVLRGAVAIEKHRLKIHLNAILKQLSQYWRYLLIFVGALIILLLPIAYAQLAHHGEISNSLSASRGNIRADAKTYGARLEEFLLPSFNNPLLPKYYETSRLNNQHSSNPSETTLYIGWTIIVFALLAVTQLYKTKLRHIKLKDNLNQSFVVGLIGLTALIVFSLSIPSKFVFLGKTIITPVDVLIHLTADWRVFSRFILVIDPLVIILAIAGIYVLTRNWRRWAYLTLLLVATVVLFLEYLTFPPRAGANLYTASPQIYHTIGKDNSVKVTASYPMLALLYVPTNFTFQQVDNKPLINANNSDLVENPFHQSIAGLRDVQTLGVLKADNVGVITTFGEDESVITGLDQYQPPDTSSAKIGLPTIYSYKIDQSVSSRSYLLTVGQGFDPTTVGTDELSHHVLSGTGTLEVNSVATEQKPSQGQYTVDFDIAPYVAATPQITIKQNGRVLWQGSINSPTHIEIQVAGNADFTLNTPYGVDVTNLSAQAQ